MGKASHRASGGHLARAFRRTRPIGLAKDPKHLSEPRRDTDDRAFWERVKSIPESDLDWQEKKDS